MAGSEFLMTEDRVVTQAPGVHTLGGQGNTLAIETARGVILVDAGPGGDKTGQMIATLRSHTDAPIHAIVYSHGHLGYNFGVDQWLSDATERGHAMPRLIAHERLPARYQRYIDTAGLQSWINTHQFRTPYPAEMRPHWYRFPTETYSDRMTIDGGDREVVLLAAPSETDDVTAVWVPDVRLLYGSAAVIKAMPNVGTPLRTLRDPIRWADTLDRLAALDPAILIAEFGAPVTDAQTMHDCLKLPATVLRWVTQQVIDRMNKGMLLDDIVHDIDYPEEWQSNRYLKQSYGCFDFIVRDVWRGQNGWWDRNPTHLHPAKPARVAEAIYALFPDPGQVLERARQLSDGGDPQLAMHVLDLVAQAPGDDEVVKAARLYKAELCERLAEHAASYVSRQLYLSIADDLRGISIAETSVSTGTWD